MSPAVSPLPQGLQRLQGWQQDCQAAESRAPVPLGACSTRHGWRHVLQPLSGTPGEPQGRKVDTQGGLRCLHLGLELAGFPQAGAQAIPPPGHGEPWSSIAGESWAVDHQCPG